jgi:hypothetical protein
MQHKTPNCEAEEQELDKLGGMPVPEDLGGVECEPREKPSLNEQ